MGLSMAMLTLMCLFKCSDISLINLFKLITCNYCQQNARAGFKPVGVLSLSWPICIEATSPLGLASVTIYRIRIFS